MPDLHSITLTWPFMAWALAVAPVLVALYAWLSIRARRRSAGLAAARAPAAAIPGAARDSVTSAWTPAAGRAMLRAWRRHAPACVVFLGIVLLLGALTRPRAVLLLPARMEAVMLAIDSSGSMRAGDVAPSRIEAAQAVARQFVRSQPAHVKLGVVSISGTATVVQGPTEDRDELLRAIEQLPLQRGSALGAGIVIALSALLPASGLELDKLLDPDARPAPRSGAPGAPGAPAAGTVPATPPAGPAPGAPKIRLDPGSNDAVSIVLMTDGQGNVGPDAVKMAQVAADLGVRVHAIGFGTPEGTVLRAHGMAARVKLDEAALKRIAEITHGEYFRAATPKDVERIYGALKMRLVMRRHRMAEITALPLLAGVLLVASGGAWSFARTGRVL